jgi:hypothetical protein
MIMMNNIRNRAAAALLAGALLATPATAGVNANGVFEGMEKVAGAHFEKFDIFSMRIDAFGTGPDGNYQALVTVRNDGDKKSNLTASSLGLTMVSVGNEPKVNIGNLYDAQAEGPLTSLVKIEDTIWLEPKDQKQVRLVWGNSKGFAPAKLRLKESQWNPGQVIYSIDN